MLSTLALFIMPAPPHELLSIYYTCFLFSKSPLLLFCGHNISLIIFVSLFMGWDMWVLWYMLCCVLLCPSFARTAKRQISIFCVQKVFLFYFILFYAILFWITHTRRYIKMMWSPVSLSQVSPKIRTPVTEQNFLQRKNRTFILQVIINTNKIVQK